MGNSQLSQRSGAWRTMVSSSMAHSKGMPSTCLRPAFCESPADAANTHGARPIGEHSRCAHTALQQTLPA
eukprot:242104-Alexandrium_andersonii.AAC.1